MKIGNIECYGVIYKITNKINEKVYIGQTTTGFKKRYEYKGEGIERVYNYHSSKKNNNNGYYNFHLLKSIEKYGFDVFEVIEIFDIAFSKEELDIKEKHYIKLFDSIENGYNCAVGGTNGNIGGLSPNAKEIICLNTKQVFPSELEACSFYNINRGNVLANCRNEQRTSGIFNGKPLIWMFLEDYKRATDEEIQEKINEANKPKKILKGKEHPMFGKVANKKKIICITTGKIFNTVKEGADYYNCCRIGISNCCKGKRTTCGRDDYGNELIWLFYNDYLKMSKEDVLNIIKNIIKKVKLADLEKRDRFKKIKQQSWKKVICITTNKIFNTAKEAGEYYNIASSSITANCRNERKSAGKLSNGTKLVWRYLVWKHDRKYRIK